MKMKSSESVAGAEQTSRGVLPPPSCTLLFLTANSKQKAKEVRRGAEALIMISVDQALDGLTYLAPASPGPQ